MGSLASSNADHGKPENITNEASSNVAASSRFEPLDWLYQPPLGGFDSHSRAYSGYQRESRSRLLRPGNPVKLELNDGDLLTLYQCDGGTTTLLLPIDPAGQFSFDSIGLADNRRVQRSDNNRDLLAIKQWYESRGGRLANNSSNNIDADEFSFVPVFDTQSTRGDEFTLRANGETTLWMLIDPELIYSSAGLFNGGMGGAIEYQHVPANTNTVQLPEPFGDVREEFTVKRGTAMAYQLSQGETVQIIDVEGQQCSDFMAAQ